MIIPSKRVLWDSFLHHKKSALSLLAANVFPLIGVLFWGWSTFAVVLVYWAENVVIGLYNVMKMICCNSALDTPQESLAQHMAKFLLVPFFAVHYGGFCLVHGMFVFVLLGGREGEFSGPFGNWDQKWEMVRETGAVWAIVALTVSHGYSFVSNYLRGGEYRKTSLEKLMGQPYGRIVVLHLAILFGAFGIVAMGSPIGLLVLLIVGKTVLDLVLHLREHQSVSDDKGHDRDHGQNRGNEGFDAGT